MEESAPKRRRISAEGEDAPAQDAPSQNTTPPRSRRKRPSFASPTKASLARHNPQILERRQSASPMKSSPSRPPARRASDATAEQSRVDEAIASELAASDPSDGAPADASDENGAPDPSRAPGGGLSAAPRRSPAKPIPRPFPPPGPEDEDENPFARRGLRRSPVTGVSFPQPPEPDLPPAVSDPISSTPPRGIHSSPLRWREKKKPKKSSPLKAPPTRPGGESQQHSESVSSSLLNRLRNAREQDAPTDESTSAARKVPKLDVNFEKKKDRNALRDEVARLKKDLETVRKENERIRLMQGSGRIFTAVDEDQVVDVVRRHLLPRDANAQQTSSQQLLKAALNPRSLFPLAKPGNFRSLVEPEPENHSDVKSHHPVSMMAAEELPYLQLFSPFTVTSDVSMLAPAPGEPLRQRYSMTLRSRDTPGLFAARIDMVVNATNFTILELDVPALEPAARAELRPFIDRICSGDCNRSMQKNVGLISWAMGEWQSIAAQRALLWSELETELSMKGDFVEKATNMRTRNQASTEDYDELGDDAPVVSCKRADLLRFMGQQAFEMTIPSTDGAETLSTVRLEWRIGFDWSGEAQNSLSVTLGVPGKWHQVDQRGALGKLPRLFDDLVENAGKPSAAVRTIVALLAGRAA